MRKLFYVLSFTSLLSASVVGQTTTTVFYFYDACLQKTIKTYYLLYPAGPLEDDTTGYWSEDSKVKDIKPGEYEITVYRDREGEVGNIVFSQTLNLIEGLITDTLEIPAINRSTDFTRKLNRGLFRKRRDRGKGVYFWNCGVMCNGKEEYRDRQGVLRIKGTFSNGVAKEISFFRADGVLESKEYYSPGNKFPDKGEYYDGSGKLVMYRTYTDEKRGYTLLEEYGADNKLIRKYSFLSL